MRPGRLKSAGSLIEPASGGPQPATTSSPRPNERVEAKRATLRISTDAGMGDLLRSVGIGREDLAAGAGRERRVHPETRPGTEGDKLVDVVPGRTGIPG